MGSKNYFVQKKTQLLYANLIDGISTHPGTIGNIAYVDFNDENLDNVRLVEVNSLPAVREHLTPNLYVDNAI